MKRIISVLLTMCIILSLCTISVIGSNAETTTEYKDEFAKFALGDKYEELKDDIFYEEYYRYFSEDNNTETPDWVFGKGYYHSYEFYSKDPLEYKFKIGDYIIKTDNVYFRPFYCGYFIYIPAENEFYAPDQLSSSKIENLNLALAFEECINKGVQGIYRRAEFYKCYDKFYNEFFNYGSYKRNNIVRYYDEVYCHYSAETEEEPDWILIFSDVTPEPIAISYGKVVGNRVLHSAGAGPLPFGVGYGVYVRKTDSFISLRNLEEIIELCPDFVEAIEENEIGQAFGDVDYNDKIDVVDATYIQRYIAEIYNGYEIDRCFGIGIVGDKSYYESIGDFDRDGETTIMDATKIQRHVAGLE